MEESSKNNKESIMLDFSVNNDGFTFVSSISTALSDAVIELQTLEERFCESIETLKS